MEPNYIFCITKTSCIYFVDDFGRGKNVQRMQFSCGERNFYNFSFQLIKSTGTLLLIIIIIIIWNYNLVCLYPLQSAQCPLHNPYVGVNVLPHTANVEPQSCVMAEHDFMFSTQSFVLIASIALNNFHVSFLRFVLILCLLFICRKSI